MGVGYVFYGIITPEGKPRRVKKGGSFMIYDSQATAQGKCREGDSVVRLVWDSDQHPLFIKSKAVTAPEEEAGE